MKWGATVFLIFFAAFILLLIFNPNLSCFGKRVRSPFTPLLRRRRRRNAERSRPLPTTDYGFHLSDDAPRLAAPAASDGAGSAVPSGTGGAPGVPASKGRAASPAETDAKKKTHDYGFKLD